MVSGVDVGVGLDDVVMSGNVLALVQYARSPLTSLPPSRTGLRAGRGTNGIRAPASTDTPQVETRRDNPTLAMWPRGRGGYEIWAGYGSYGRIHVWVYCESRSAG
jgi:hypothetical protein